MLLLIAGLVLFLGTHSVSMIAQPWRDRVVARLGELPWKFLYSVLALSGLVLIVLGYGAVRQSPEAVILYTPPSWLRHVSLLLMLPVFALLVSAYLPGRLSRTTKHPMLLAVKLWALAHLLANGMLADVMLFGTFLMWAVADRVSLKSRSPATVPVAPEGRWNDLIALAAGLGLYVAFILGLHRWLIGVSPIG